MLKYIVFILMINGEMVLERYELKKPIYAMECLDLADKLRKENTTYDGKNNLHWLNNKKGTWWGHFCE